MPNNKVDQAPKLKSNGEKFPNNLTWGKAIYSQEFMAICCNLLSLNELKLMLYYAGNAEEKFDVSKKGTANRTGIGENNLYTYRKKLVDRGWITVKDEKDKSYIYINYDKIYQDGVDKGIIKSFNKNGTGT